MRTFITILIIAGLFGTRTAALAQQMPEEVISAIQKDDTTRLNTLINKDNINECYGYYSVLSQTVRANAIKCFNLMISKGADVNLSCSEYVPPLMHAVKYGHLDMVKILIARGAHVNYQLEAEIDMPGGGPEKGETPLSYAIKFKHKDIEDYLRSVKP